MAKPKTFSNRVRTLLEERGWTQSTLAEIARVNPGHLSRLLSGRRRWSLPYLEQVARAFDLDPVEFAADTTEADLVRPNAGVIERDYAETLGNELAKAAGRVQELEAELAALRETNTKQEAELRQREDAVRERDAVRKSALDTTRRLEAVNRDLVETRATLERSQVAERQLRQQNARLLENLNGANRQVLVNYDAWRQADAQAKSLARRLGEQGQQTAGAALFAGLIGLGIGVAAKSK